LNYGIEPGHRARTLRDKAWALGIEIGHSDKAWNLAIEPGNIMDITLSLGIDPRNRAKGERDRYKA
jgi:hypothetical protein